MRISTSARLAEQVFLLFASAPPMRSNGQAQPRSTSLYAAVTGLGDGTGKGVTISIGSRSYSEATGALSLSDIKIAGPAGSPAESRIASITAEGWRSIKPGYRSRFIQADAVFRHYRGRQGEGQLHHSRDHANSGALSDGGSQAGREWRGGLSWLGEKLCLAIAGNRQEQWHLERRERPA